MSALDALRAVDASGQLDDVLGLPDHLRDAIWRVESAEIAPAASTGLVVCGMGGSAIGGDLAKAAIGERLKLPLETARGYDLPRTLPEHLGVLCSSYSGDTEETLACYAAAGTLGARRIVASTGGALTEAARRDGTPVIPLPAGLQPRAAVGYMFTAAVEAARLSGVGPAIQGEIESAATHLESARDALLERAAALAETLAGSVPVIAGAELTAPVAYRWKSQVNENAEWPAFASEMPELDHNEIVGWRGTERGNEETAGPFTAVFLVDRDQHPRVRERFELTAELIAEQAARVETIETEGDTRAERLLWAVHLGDLISLCLAGLRNVDPAPVAVIETLKDRLGGP